MEPTLHFAGEILNDDSPASATVLGLLGASAKGSAQDKLRLLSIYMLSAGAKPETVTAGQDALKAQGIDMGALKHVEEVKKHDNLASHRKSSAASSASSQDVAAKAWSFGGQALGGMSKLLVRYCYCGKCRPPPSSHCDVFPLQFTEWRVLTSDDQFPG